MKEKVVFCFSENPPHIQRKYVVDKRVAEEIEKRLKKHSEESVVE